MDILGKRSQRVFANEWGISSFSPIFMNPFGGMKRGNSSSAFMVIMVGSLPRRWKLCFIRWRFSKNGRPLRTGRPFDLLPAAVGVRTPVRQVDVDSRLTTFHHKCLHRYV